MAKHIEDVSQFLQSFGVAPLALLFLPVLITALARNVILALATGLLSFASLMLFVAPASATSGLAIVSGLGHATKTEPSPSSLDAKGDYATKPPSAFMNTCALRTIYEASSRNA
jgi:hypothetical protein